MEDLRPVLRHRSRRADHSDQSRTAGHALATELACISRHKSEPKTPWPCCSSGRPRSWADLRLLCSGCVPDPIARRGERIAEASGLSARTADRPELQQTRQMRLGPAFTGETCEKCRLEQFAEKFGNVSFRTSAVFAGARNLLCFQSKRISHLVLDDSFSMCSASCGPLAELFPGRTV